MNLDPDRKRFLKNLFVGCLVFGVIAFRIWSCSDHDEHSQINGYDVAYSIYTLEKDSVQPTDQRALRIKYATRIDIYKNGAIIESARPKLEAEMLGIFESSRSIIQRQPLDVVFLEVTYFKERRNSFNFVGSLEMTFKKNGDVWEHSSPK